MVIGHEKGNDTASRLRHNFGMGKPEGYRKAIRLMQLADRFGLPVVTLIDTSGAFPGIQADGFAVVTVDVAQLWDAKESKPLHVGLAKIKARLTRDIEAEFGLKIEEIERVTYYWSAIADPDRKPSPFRFETARKPFTFQETIRYFLGIRRVL